jgi:hypothetical protein
MSSPVLPGPSFVERQGARNNALLNTRQVNIVKTPAIDLMTWTHDAIQKGIFT